MVSILIPFVLNDATALQSAIQGLKEVTNILAKHSYAEREFLLREQTRADFQATVVPLYMSILEYQAGVALYFAKSTMARLGINLMPRSSWQDALATTNKLAYACQRPLADLSTRLTRLGFDQVEESLREGRMLLQNIAKAVASTDHHREKVQQWFSPIEPLQNHGLIKQRLGKSYHASGRWLLEDPTTYLAWKANSSGVILLQGIVGSGKSALTSIAVEDLLRHENGRVCFVYCTASSSDASVLNTNVTSSILRSLLAQLVIRPDGSVSPRAQTAYENNIARDSRSSLLEPSHVVTFIQSVLEECPNEQISLVIDALDECSNYDEVLRHLADLQRIHSRMRIFFSARFGVMVAPHFPDYRHVPISTQNTDDIRTYVEREVSMRYESVGFSKDQAVRLKLALIRMAEGM
jgi:hypothetical protein